MSIRTARTGTAPAPGGGALAFTHWPGADGSASADTPALIALHGITANGRAFDAVADALGAALPCASLYAPDLRGRAASADLPGPYGLAAHVADVLALLDHLGQRRAVLIGHSMGGFVAALAATRHPSRVAGTVLVDGGPPFPGTGAAGGDSGAGETGEAGGVGEAGAADEGAIDAQLEAVIGPAMRRLSMTFPDRDSYAEFFRGHPAIRPLWNDDVRAYVDRDLVGTEPELRSSCVREAVRADGRGVLVEPLLRTALREPGPPAVFLWAERGMLDEPRGLYGAEHPAGFGLHPERVASRRVDGVNHYSIVMAAEGARAVAEAAAEVTRRAAA
ncbi:alpha/beta hydrolase [Streptomyces tubbatahanensis]|uniref:Alpha/beta hydrolase n=1 Tax=Streptomyces tubbatahanensis TaxID=2923272 RepID=A0ABY3XTQ9_9ACTN|nr:alpha/beta fold hydrolase [Streptomyces tubbatahanensis]UNS97686.1 alpha/beta hydrolase [Streptomyces tubbatahanensis]